MSVSVHANTDEFNDVVRTYIKTLGVSVREGLRTQARLLFGYVIDKTPPRTRARGKKLVDVEVRRAIRPLSPQDWKEPAIRMLIRERDYAGLQTVFDRSGGSRKVLPFSPDLHRRARDRRGRVLGETRQVTPDRGEVREYLKRVQARVGIARGGWAAAQIAVGGKPAAWVARWAAMGRVSDRLGDPLSPTVTAENLSEWATHGDDNRIVDAAVRGRTTAILRDIKLRLERAAARSARSSPRA